MFILLCFGLIAGLWGQTPVAADDPPPDARKIVSRMEEVRQRIHEEIRQYTSYRNYFVHNERFDFSRELPVRMDYKAPWYKEYKVPEDKASGLFYSKVFQRILDSEVQHARPGFRVVTAISSRNYEFELEGAETVDGEPCWRLRLNPKRESKFLLKGLIWISQADHQTVRLDGHPAKSPSFWTKDVHLVRSYRKVGNYWLPREDRSINEIRIFGRTEFRIDYQRYELPGQAETPLTGGARPQSRSRGDQSSLD
jgi:hypothetical protein